MVRLRTVDAHVGGAPVRLVVEGAPSIRGGSMRAKTDWLARHGDHLRRMLMREPRGHRDMTGVMLTEPVTPGSHAGLIFMHGDGYAPMSGHSVLGATFLALRHGLILTGESDRGVIYDTVAGTIAARVLDSDDDDENADGLGGRIAFVNVPAFVLRGGLTAKAAGRHVRVDIAYGGAFYAIVDAESVGLSVASRFLPGLREIAGEVIRLVEGAFDVAHPLEASLGGLSGAIFTAPPAQEGADLRAVTILRQGVAGRSASGSGMSAVMAVLSAMGLLADNQPFRQEGLLGLSFAGRVLRLTSVADLPAIVPEIEGTAWPTGEHAFLAERGDPFAAGAGD
jgi:proline racemase